LLFTEHQCTHDSTFLIKFSRGLLNALRCVTFAQPRVLLAVGSAKLRSTQAHAL
jgi:hypothetical protein